MLKQNTRRICITVLVLLLILFSAFLRNMWRFISLTDRGGFLTTSLRSIIYISMFSAWCYSLRQRIIQKQTKCYLTTISALMVFWLVARTLKFLFVSDLHVSQYLWYLYYFPMLFIPLLALLVALSLGKSENFRLPKWSNLFFGISVLFLLLVLSNDFHQLILSFPYGLLSFSNGEYTHELCYYLAMGWMALCKGMAFLVIVVKCRVSSSRKLISLPCLPLIALVVYAILYLTVSDLIYPFIGDMTVVVCLLFAAALESLIQCGLIQSNTRYDMLFEATSIRAKITDRDYNILLSYAEIKPTSKTLMRQTEAAPVLLEGGVRLCSAPITEGFVMCSEDVSEITEVIAELADNSEYLTTRRSMLHKEVETSQEEQRLAEQNRLYNRLMNQNKEKLSLYAHLIEQLAATNGPEQEKKLTAKLAVVCTHIKRRGNLLFLSDKGEKINPSEVQFALEEWLSNLLLCGVKCNLYFNMTSPLSFGEIVALYDTFQQALLYTLDSLHSLLVSADEINSNPILILNLSCDRDLSEVSIPGIAVSDEGDGEWVIRISIPEGGAVA